MTMELALGIFGTIAALGSGAWAVIRAFGFLVNKVVAQFETRLDERFKAQETLRVDRSKVWEARFVNIDQRYERIDRELRELLISMPDKYVRREDYVRRETIIEGKIDQLGLRIQNWILENKHG